MFKLIVFAALFVLLCVKGGELCLASGVQALTQRADGEEASRAVRKPDPLKPREERFRGLSPWPGFAARLPLPSSPSSPSSVENLMGTRR